MTCNDQWTMDIMRPSEPGPRCQDVRDALDTLTEGLSEDPKGNHMTSSLRLSHLSLGSLRHI